MNNSFLNMKIDKRTKRGWWAPGNYFRECCMCEQGFSGDKRAEICADCAYSTPTEAETETENTLSQDLILKLYSEDAGRNPQDLIKVLDEKLRSASVTRSLDGSMVVYRTKEFSVIVSCDGVEFLKP